MAGAFLANHVYHRRSPGVWGQYVGHWEMNWCNLLIVGVSGINLKSFNLFPSSSSVWLFACAKRLDNAEIALAKQMARFGSIYPYQQCCSCSELDIYGFGMSIVEKDFGVFRCLPRSQIEAKEVEKTFGIFKFPSLWPKLFANYTGWTALHINMASHVHPFYSGRPSHTSWAQDKYLIFTILLIYNLSCRDHYNIIPREVYNVATVSTSEEPPWISHKLKMDSFGALGLQLLHKPISTFRCNKLRWRTSGASPT